MPARESSLNGLLVVDKPGRAHDEQAILHGNTAVARPPTLPVQQRHDTYLLTSHDVVGRVRRWSGQRRIGHTGTLDPMASGVLLLCLGSATRLVEYYQGERKRYYAEIALGAATDSYDAEGTVTATARVPLLDVETIEQALAAFRGTVLQRPPAFSAIKQGGEALYHKARRGEEVEIAPREVTFHQLDLLAFDAPDRIQLRVLCSAGGYIRSLAHDLAQALGTYGHLAVLRREAVGAFTLDDAHSLESIEEAARASRLHTLLKAPGWGLPLPVVRVEDDLIRRLGFGQVVALAAEPCDPVRHLAQIHDTEGQFAGIARRLRRADDGDRWLWKAEKWLR